MTYIYTILRSKIQSWSKLCKILFEIFSIIHILRYLKSFTNANLALPGPITSFILVRSWWRRILPFVLAVMELYAMFWSWSIWYQYSTGSNTSLLQMLTGTLLGCLAVWCHWWGRWCCGHWRRQDDVPFAFSPYWKWFCIVPLEFFNPFLFYFCKNYLEIW